MAEQEIDLRTQVMQTEKINSPFYITQQESLVTEKFSRNGRTMDLHLVAKNVSFNIYLTSTFDLNKYPPTAKLIYDFDEMGEFRDVEQLKTPPLEIITHVDKSNRTATVEAKISVLSSQHERALFRIKLSQMNPIGETLVAYTQPIKVIAKRNQVRKMLERKLQTQIKNENSIVSTPVGVVNLAQLAPHRERPHQDSILQTLERIEQQQKNQWQFMQRLAKGIPLSSEGRSEEPQLIKQPIQKIPDPNDSDFRTTFKKFLSAFSDISPEERPNKLRRLLLESDKSDVSSLDEFVSIYNSEMKPPPLEDITNEECTQCKHKQELDMLSTFYNDFLKDPTSPEII